ncbi:MAG TPA: hypothetical protein VFZ53_23585 [Polyangiaceae bacterium]
MIGVRNRSLPATVVVATGLAVFLAPSAARAEVTVAVRYESDDQLEVARRITSELSAEGYTVDVVGAGEPSPCDPNGPRVVAVEQRAAVWIRVASDPAGSGAVIASICYLGTLPFLQRASVSAPNGEPQALALATAEALNGLRSKLPPLAANPEHAVAAAPPRDATAPPAAPRAEPLVNSALVGTALVLNLPDFPVAPGFVGRATLGVVPALDIVIDAFVPTTGREVSSDDVTATLRTTWLRVGPRWRGAAGDVALSAAALAGPAVTWATGEADAPRVGTIDVTTGAVLSLAAFVEYPRSGAIFACASASASALLPGVRVELGDGDPPEGAWPVEAAIGFGVRWGGKR